MKPKRQTISYLTRRFAEVGLQPNSRHGQNFLIDLNLIELLARSAKLRGDEVVLEVGTGTGSLTSLLAEKAAAVVTVEIDEHLHLLAREELEACDNVFMLKQDALKNKNNLHPNIIDTVKKHLGTSYQRRFVVCANLPYNIATPIISNLMTTEIVPESICVTIQKELADRICAKPSTKDYSALSIWLQSLCDVEIVRVLPPSVFWPRPKVHSAIIRVIPNPEKRAQIEDLEFFHRFVRALFFHRRKFLRSVLASAFKNQLEKPDIDKVMQANGHGPTSRAEELTIEQIKTLCFQFREIVDTVS
jgi:16S rRNA (adenine1518-N6/adenine1519-N6)-dimethyltransferase